MSPFSELEVLRLAMNNILRMKIKLTRILRLSVRFIHRESTISPLLTVVVVSGVIPGVKKLHPRHHRTIHCAVVRWITRTGYQNSPCRANAPLPRRRRCSSGFRYIVRDSSSLFIMYEISNKYIMRIATYFRFDTHFPSAACNFLMSQKSHINLSVLLKLSALPSR